MCVRLHWHTHVLPSLALGNEKYFTPRHNSVSVSYIKCSLSSVVGDKAAAWLEKEKVGRNIGLAEEAS